MAPHLTYASPDGALGWEDVYWHSLCEDGCQQPLQGIVSRESVKKGAKGLLSFNYDLRLAGMHDYQSFSLHMHGCLWQKNSAEAQKEAEEAKQAAGEARKELEAAKEKEAAAARDLEAAQEHHAAAKKQLETDADDLRKELKQVRDKEAAASKELEAAKLGAYKREASLSAEASSLKQQLEEAAKREAAAKTELERLTTELQRVTTEADAKAAAASATAGEPLKYQARICTCHTSLPYHSNPLQSFKSPSKLF